MAALSASSLTDDIKIILNKLVNTTTTETIPKLDDQLPSLYGNDGKEFIGAILFIDMRGSTKLFSVHKDNVIGKIMMSYHKGITQIAKSHSGEIRSFNGDSLLVFFEGNTKQAINSAVKCAMQIKCFINNILNPLLAGKGYSKIDFGIGIDHGKVLCLKAGISGEGNRDLIWVSEYVNMSAKLGNLGRSPNNIYISQVVYVNLFDSHKYSNTQNMWSYLLKDISGTYKNIYFTSYHWTIT